MQPVHRDQSLLRRRPPAQADTQMSQMPAMARWGAAELPSSRCCRGRAPRTGLETWRLAIVLLPSKSEASRPLLRRGSRDIQRGLFGEERAAGSASQSHEGSARKHFLDDANSRRDHRQVSRSLLDDEWPPSPDEVRRRQSAALINRGMVRCHIGHHVEPQTFYTLARPLASRLGEPVALYRDLGVRGKQRNSLGRVPSQRWRATSRSMGRKRSGSTRLESQGSIPGYLPGGRTPSHVIA